MPTDKSLCLLHAIKIREYLMFSNNKTYNEAIYPHHKLNKMYKDDCSLDDKFCTLYVTKKEYNN